MDRLQQLYREVILEHSRRPRNFRRLATPSACADGVNPLCGDRLRLCLQRDGERIVDAGFEGAGCAISLASASLLTEAVTGLSRHEAEALAERLAAVLRGESAASESPGAELGALDALRGVSAFPTRIKCATLAWQALLSALRGGETSVSTEQTLEPSDQRPAVN